MLKDFLTAKFAVYSTRWIMSGFVMLPFMLIMKYYDVPFAANVIIGQIIGGFTWVQITKRWGNTFLMMISHILPILIASLGIISFFVASATGKSCFPFIAVMVVMTGMNLSAWLGYAHRVIDTVDPNKRTGYLVLQSLLQFPFTFFSLPSKRIPY